jgi:hypothetical protein
MTKTRFDLEQEILDCWHVTDDIQAILDTERLDLNDEMQNVLIGLKTLYQLKFERTFSTFEQLIRERKLDRIVM